MCVCVFVCVCLGWQFLLDRGPVNPPVLCGDSAKYGLCVLYEGRREGRGVVLLAMIEILIV